jgi:thiol-disulfide isomerase/thioredoxin
MKTNFLLALACLVLATGASRADSIGIGDNAPKLEVKEFVKGEPVKEFKPGQIYVVEFWATWCGPCRATIPHLTKLQQEHGAKVVFIGVSVWEPDQKKVVPFVKEMGDKMEYRVAMDKVTENENGNDGPMAKNWMTAADQNAIPRAFVINGEGKVAWIGHPAEMDKPLGEIIAGTYDLQAAKVAFRKEAESKAKMNALRTRLITAQRESPAALIKVIDEAIKETPDLEDTLGLRKFNAMLADKDTNQQDYVKYGQHLINETLKDNPDQLNNMAWNIVDPDNKKKPNKAKIQLALDAAKQADKVAEGKRPEVTDTLARAYFVSGDVKKALECQQRAYKLGKGTAFEDEIKSRLVEYQKAAKK